MRIVLLSTLLGGCTAATGPVAPATELAWLAGTWSTDDGRATTTESWSVTPGGTLLGQGSVGVHTPSGDAIVFAESLAITADTHGLAYVAWPNGQVPVTFRAVSRGYSEVQFENPEHDFPRRLHYARVGEVLEVTATGVNEDGSARTDTAKLTLVGPPGSQPKAPHNAPPAPPAPEAAPTAVPTGAAAGAATDAPPTP